MEHDPVLLGTVVDLLVPPLVDGGVFVDGTLGRAGHARALLEAAPQATLVGIDRDPDALAASRRHLDVFGERVQLVHGDFAELPSILERLGIPSLRGVLLDLGVSSPQLDEAHRGFSFRNDGPLDMRMDPTSTLSADDVVNRYEPGKLERVISRFGQERFARRITRAIVAKRPVTSTAALADIVKEAIPAATRRTGGHPARRTFQAIRMEVNDELGRLERALPAAIEALQPSGRIVVLSYHSLEDRLVKRTFFEEARGCVCPADLPVCMCDAHARLRLVTRGAVKASDEEVAANPRSKSVRLRAGERLETNGAVRFA